MNQEVLKEILGQHSLWVKTRFEYDKQGQRANLERANLRGAYLRRAYLEGAYLEGAYLEGAYLEGAYLEGAYLEGAYLEGAEKYIPINCPEVGEFTGYKKAYEDDGISVIVELKILKDSIRFSATGRKCRCNKAKVLSITSIDGRESFDIASSGHNSSFKYKVGELVEVKNFDEYRWNECSTGIHFFITRQEAVEY